MRVIRFSAMVLVRLIFVGSIAFTSYWTLWLLGWYPARWAIRCLSLRPDELLSDEVGMAFMQPLWGIAVILCVGPLVLWLWDTQLRPLWIEAGKEDR